MPDALIFDDDPGVGALIGEVLRGRGLSSVHFPSGAGVVQIVKDAHPRLVVLDIMMPGVDGLTACRSIRETPATRHVKIIVLTAKHFEADREAAKRYGADLFVNKPFNTAILSANIGKLPTWPNPWSPPLRFRSRRSSSPSCREGRSLEIPGLWVFLRRRGGAARWFAEKTILPLWSGCCSRAMTTTQSSISAPSPSFLNPACASTWPVPTTPILFCNALLRRWPASPARKP